MVRFFNYSIPQNEVIPICSEILQNIGYEIAILDYEDHQLLTNIRTIRKGLRRAEVFLYIKVDDRIKVFIYSENWIYNRSMEIAIFSTELTKQVPSNDLSYSFQQFIYKPVLNEFGAHGFDHWDYAAGNREDIKEIVEAIENDELVKADRLRIEQMRENIQKSLIINDYQLNMDKARSDAVNTVEGYVEFMANNKLDYYSNWSLIHIKKVIHQNQKYINKIIGEVMSDDASYSGEGIIQCVIDPIGRVRDVRSNIETDPSTLETELNYRLTHFFSTLLFPTKVSKVLFINIELIITFDGQYNNFNYSLTDFRILNVYESFPQHTIETLPDTLFQPN
mgnify:CR=1 FL=1|tara:strand:- start:154 stop:1161 length:1008 start_codon:yes stop_codon:yes gene_type:complete